MKFDSTEEVAAEAGQLPLNYDSRPSIQLPGSRAPVFHGRKLLKCCWRFLLRSRCRLSSFARSFVSRRFDQCECAGTAARNVFPMPLPYPEVLREGSDETSLKGAVKRWICGLVVCLNYLFLGRPRSAGYENWVGRSLTRKQWDTVKRLEHLSAAWFHVSPGRILQSSKGIPIPFLKLVTQPPPLSPPGVSCAVAGIKSAAMIAFQRP